MATPAPAAAAPDPAPPPPAAAADRGSAPPSPPADIASAPPADNAEWSDSEAPRPASAAAPAAPDPETSLQPWPAAARCPGDYLGRGPGCIFTAVEKMQAMSGGDGLRGSDPGDAGFRQSLMLVGEHWTLGVRLVTIQDVEMTRREAQPEPSATHPLSAGWGSVCLHLHHRSSPLSACSLDRSPHLCHTSLTSLPTLLSLPSHTRLYPPHPHPVQSSFCSVASMSSPTDSPPSPSSTPVAPGRGLSRHFDRPRSARRAERRMHRHEAMLRSLRRVFIIPEGPPLWTLPRCGPCSTNLY